MSSRGASVWGAIPDGLTAAGFIVVWISPFYFGELSVKTAMLIMLMEFFIIHGAGFFTVIGGMADLSRTRRVLFMLGLSLFYLLMVGALAWSFGEWWPLLAFAWLVLGKIVWTLRIRHATEEVSALQMAAWAGSGVAYLLGCFVTALLPVPRLGMHAELQPSFGLGEDSGGLWIDEPHRVVAFGVLYFGLLCAGKILVARYPAKA